MPKVSAEISMSLDGFITGPDDGPEFGLGRGGERLHEWIYGLATWRKPHGLEGGVMNRDAEIVDEAYRDIGAFIMGRRMFQIGEPHWGDDPPFHKPVFVLSHQTREPVVKHDTTFTYVQDVESALKQAKAAAGKKDVLISGGAEAIQQFLKAGLLDEIQIHLVPVVLGAGRPLFGTLGDQIELQPDRVIDSPGVTHLRYRVVK